MPSLRIGPFLDNFVQSWRSMHVQLIIEPDVSKQERSWHGNPWRPASTQHCSCFDSHGISPFICSFACDKRSPLAWLSSTPPGACSRLAGVSSARSRNKLVRIAGVIRLRSQEEHRLTASHGPCGSDRSDCTISGSDMCVICT